MRDYVGRGLLDGKRALITGGDSDSGIGRAVAVAFAMEGADIAIAYLEEHEDAKHTASLVQDVGRRCLQLPGDLADAEQCRAVVARTADELGGLDILVNNVAYQNRRRTSPTSATNNGGEPSRSTSTASSGSPRQPSNTSALHVFSWAPFAGQGRFLLWRKGVSAVRVK